jgi:hypothetical protein
MFSAFPSNEGNPMDDTAQPARYPNGRFGPGNPGRPLGARNRKPQRLANAILEHFQEHQEAVLQRLNERFFPEYVRLIGRLLPKQVDFAAPRIGELTNKEAAEILMQVRGAVDRAESGEGCLADIEAALSGETLALGIAPKSGRPWSELSEEEEASEIRFVEVWHKEQKQLQRLRGDGR